MKNKLVEQYKKLEEQSKQYQTALQNNHNTMQQIIGKLQLLEEQSKVGEGKEVKKDKK